MASKRGEGGAAKFTKRVLAPSYRMHWYKDKAQAAHAAKGYGHGRAGGRHIDLAAAAARRPGEPSRSPHPDLPRPEPSPYP